LHYSVRLPEHRSDVFELAERGDQPGSSFSFQAFQDDWKLGDGGVPERHLVSGRLIDVAPTAVPAYPDSSIKVAYRSLAMRFDADEDEVAELIAQGKGRSLFQRTDIASLPEGLVAAEVRSAAPSGNGDLEIRRRKNALEGRKVAAPKTLDNRLLELYRRRNDWYAPVETRSVDAYLLDLLMR
jgi:hypothetical protein